MFGFKKRRKDPICGMKEMPGKGIEKNGIWFCADNCLEQYEHGAKGNKMERGSCCP